MILGHFNLNIYLIVISYYIMVCCIIQAKVNPAEVALLRQLDSIQDPMFVNFLKSNLNSGKNDCRDKKSENCNEEPSIA